MRLNGAGADIVLLELDLGGEGGFALLRRLQDEARPEWAVVLTGERHPEYVREALRLGDGVGM